MTGQIRNVVAVRERCVFCGGTPDSPEHVLPNWFLRLWDDTGPFTMRINNEPLRTRAGRLSTSLKMWRVILPCCRRCNGDLDRRFEKTAKGPLRQLLRDMRPIEDQDAVSSTARWLIKTLALTSHPSANHTAFSARAERDRNRPWNNYPRAVLDSLKAGVIPTDTSLWLAVTEPYKPGLPDPPFENVLLRRTTRADGLGGCGRTRTMGFGLADGRVAWFQLVYHPLHDLEHPFEHHKLVTRLWPKPPARLDIGEQSVLDHKTRLAEVFIDGGFCHGLTLGERSNGNGIPWHEW